jgi:hypothetical protein
MLFYFICDVKIIANFAPNFAKLVEITLGKHIFRKFPWFFCEKQKKFTQNKNTDWRHKLIILTKRTKFTIYKM